MKSTNTALPCPRAVDEVAKIGWIVLVIAATIIACLALVWMYVETSSTSSLASANFLNIMEILCVLFFTLDYPLRSHASKSTFPASAKQSMDIIDAVTTLPFYPQIFIASVGASAGDLFRLVHCIRMLRVVRLGRYHTGMRNSATLLAFLGGGLGGVSGDERGLLLCRADNLRQDDHGCGDARRTRTLRDTTRMAT